VGVVNDQWCWKSKTVDTEVIDSDLTSVDFTQTGFMLSASLSHSILLVSTDCSIHLHLLLLEFFDANMLLTLQLSPSCGRHIGQSISSTLLCGRVEQLDDWIYCRPRWQIWTKCALCVLS